MLFVASISLIAKEEPHRGTHGTHPGQHPNNTHHNVNNANFHHINGVNANPGVGGTGGAVVVPQTTTVIPVQDPNQSN